MKTLPIHCKQCLIGEYSAMYLWDNRRTRQELKILLNNTQNGKTSSLIKAMLNYRQDELKKFFLNNGKVSSDNFTVGDLIRVMLPNSRILIILRDPVER